VMRAFIAPLSRI